MPDRRAPVGRLLAAAAALASCAPPPRAPAASVEIASGSAGAPRPARKAPPDIREVSPDVFEIPADLFDRIVEEPRQLDPNAYLEAVEQDGAVVGYRLRGVRRGSVFARLGLWDDDLIEIVNGEALLTPQAISAARASARRTGQVTVVVSRHGRKWLLIYRLVYHHGAVLTPGPSPEIPERGDAGARERGDAPRSGPHPQPLSGNTGEGGEVGARQGEGATLA